MDNNRISLNALRDKAYLNATNHGWHEVEHNAGHYVMLIITELNEAVNADRLDKHANKELFNMNLGTPSYQEDKHFMKLYDLYIKDTMEDELADAAIRMLDFTKVLEVDLNFNLPTPDEEELMLIELTAQPYLTHHVLALIMVLLDDADVIKFLKSIFIIAKWHKIDLMWHIEQKMKYNEMRPYKHGGKKY